MSFDLIFMKKRIVDAQSKHLQKVGAFTQPNDDRIFVNMFSGDWKKSNIEKQINKTIFHELVHKHGNKGGKTRDELEIEEAVNRVFSKRRRK